MTAPAAPWTQTRDHAADPTTDPTDVLAYALAGLLLEIRPDLPTPVAVSMAVEAIDQTAGVVLDQAWARQRARLWPEAVAAARTRRYLPRAARRTRELHAARPRSGDYPGGPVPWEPCHPATEAA